MCESLSRRDFVSRGAGAALAVGAPGVFRLPRFDELGGSTRPHLEVALRAWEWIRSHRVVTDHGVTWPADPIDRGSIGASLYTHAPGVIPFALELFHTTRDQEYLDEAMAGADDMVARVEPSTGAGLYTGLAGMAFVLEETFRASGIRVYRTHAQRLAERLVESAARLDGGVAWPMGTGDRRMEVHDIVSGTAGTGLGLLYLYDRMREPALLDTARAAAHRLLQHMIPADPGRRWDMRPGYEREMPNFSHGTAGIAYFLAAVHRRAEELELLDAALAGARYLQSIATVRDGGYRILHHRPGGEDLYYLSWCHGPVGTNRLFEELYRVTGDASWDEWVGMGARGIMRTGIPEQRTPGFWENISQCCGNAGVGEMFLSLYHRTGLVPYREFVTRLNDDLLRRSTRDTEGLKWIQSEHRVRPELLVAQTGFMQGAAGAGKYFLHADAMETNGRGPVIRLPDDPLVS